MKKIKVRRKYFGVEKEKLDALKVLKNSLIDFYITIVIAMVALVIVETMEILLNDSFFEIRILASLLFHIAVLLAIFFTQREIRCQLRQLFLPCCTRNIDPENTATFELSKKCKRKNREVAGKSNTKTDEKRQVTLEIRQKQDIGKQIQTSEYLSERRVTDKYGQLLSSGRQYQKGLDKIKQLEHALRQMISKIQRLICL